MGKIKNYTNEELLVSTVLNYCGLGLTKERKSFWKRLVYNVDSNVVPLLRVCKLKAFQ